MLFTSSFVQTACRALIISLLCVSSAWAAAPQFPVPSSRAKNDVRQFQRAADKAAEAQNTNQLKSSIQRMERYLKRIKKFDPNYNAAPLEAYLKQLQAQLQAAQSAGDKAKNLARKFDQEVYYLHTASLQQNWTSPKDNAPLEAKVKAYRERAEALTTAQYKAIPDRAERLKSYRRTLAGRSQNIEREIQKLQAQLKNDRLGGHPSYNEVLVVEAEWYAGKVLFPDDAGIQQAYQKMHAFHQSLGGSRAAFIGKKAQADQAQLAQVKIPPATTRDPQLEALFRKVFLAQGWNEEIQLLHITSDWYPKRQAVTGKLLGRVRDAAIVAKQASGKCRLYDFSIHQDAVGNSFSSQARRSSHSGRWIKCLK